MNMIPSGSHPVVPSRDYLDVLNAPQRQAVETTEGPVLVLAGAGTGKTRVLISRLAHIVACQLARPYQILAVTFTNKAAGEMRERVAALLQENVEGFWLGTFHSLGLKILRRYCELLGFHRDFTILDMDDQHRLIKQILKAQGIDDKRNPPKVVAGIISRWKDRALTPEKVTPGELGGHRLILDVYKEYQQRLQILNAMDFGDLLLHCLTLFERHPDVLLTYQHQFRYILVDEYQDTNVAQYLWLRLLAMHCGNICCVGDEDQSIYAWRGAEIGNILRFEHDFPGATIIRLEQNYRSTPHILGAASGLIQHNRGRFGKTLWTESTEGEKVIIRETHDSNEEAQFVCREIEKLHQQQARFSQMAILVRASFQTREFEERLLTIGIPYRVIGGLRFYERQEIRDAIAYLRLVIQPEDGLAFERIVNVPRRGIGPTTLQTIHTAARNANMSVTRMAREMVERDEVRGTARTGLRRLFADLDRWRQGVSQHHHSDLLCMILDESGYTQMWKDDKSPDAPGRLENLKELTVALKQYESLQAFLEHVSLVTEASSQSNDDMVSLMTLHGAKGLEFDMVFLPAWEEGIFPHQRSLAESGGEGLEEERRLAYVGLTRAKKRATITYARNRRTFQGWQYSRPSRFIKELPSKHIRWIKANGSESDEMSDFMLAGNVYHEYHHDRHGGPIIDADFTEEPSHGFKLHERVFHQKFGYGKIMEINGDTLHINFESSGMKTVMASFVGHIF